MHVSAELVSSQGVPSGQSDGLAQAKPPLLAWNEPPGGIGPNEDPPGESTVPPSEGTMPVSLPLSTGASVPASAATQVCDVVSQTNPVEQPPQSWTAPQLSVIEPHEVPPPVPHSTGGEAVHPQTFGVPPPPHVLGAEQPASPQ